MSKKISLGEAIPELVYEASGGKTINVSDFRGKNSLVLYFYPKDNTSGCAREGEDFKKHYLKFKRVGAVILGVSRDSVASHDRFQQKYQFPFDLLSDPDESLCDLFDVIKMKNMYGKSVRGIERSTFVIDKQGLLAKEWRKVKVDGHVEQVLIAVKQMSK